MNIKQKIYCPNCGRTAEKHQCSETSIIRTSCPECDYLLVQDFHTGRVIEAYAPGINFAGINFTPAEIAMRAVAHKQH